MKNGLNMNLRIRRLNWLIRVQQWAIDLALKIKKQRGKLGRNEQRKKTGVTKKQSSSKQRK